MAKAYVSIFYIFLTFAALGFAAWIVSKFWPYIIVVALMVGAVRIYYMRNRYW